LLLHTRPRLERIRRGEQWLPDLDLQRGLPLTMLRRVEEYIHGHLDCALDVGEMAAVLGISLSHFTRRFRASAGLTPHRLDSSGHSIVRGPPREEP
jgi:AraC-like DNA-binding protein